MGSTADQRRKFGAELRRRRLDHGLTAAQLGEALSGVVADGDSWSHAAVTSWERGQWAPRSVAIIDALEEILDVEDSAFRRLLGYGPAIDGQAGATLTDRVAALEGQMAEALEILREIQGRSRGGRGARR